MIATHRQERLKLDKWDGLLALVVGGVALLLYGRTVTPGLLAGDGGEFQTLTYLLGSTHPTGYPVYLPLARLFALLPLGDLAYRVNLFSAFMGGVTVAGLYLCGRLLSGYRGIATAVAITFAVSATFWSQALIAEVYSTGAAFIVFIILALLWWDIFKSEKALFIAGLLGGLGLGVHMSVALLAPAILLFLLLHWRRGRQMWKTAVLGALSGLLLTVLLFVLIDRHETTANYFESAVVPSRSSWNLSAEQIDGPIERLIFGWQGRQFQYLMFADMAATMARQANDYRENLSGEFAWPLILAVSIGILSLLLRRPRVAALLLAALVVQLGFFFNYDIWDLYVFYIPSYLLLALLACAGLGVLVLGVNYVWKKLTTTSRASDSAFDLIFALLLLIFAVWPQFQPQQAAFVSGEMPSFGFDEYPEYDENLRPFAAAVVTNLPQDAIVFTDWDMMWPFYHVAYLENGRFDLTFIETTPADDEYGIADSAIEFVAVNAAERPIYFSERISKVNDAGFTFAPVRVGPFRAYKIQE